MVIGWEQLIFSRMIFLSIIEKLPEYKNEVVCRLDRILSNSKTDHNE